MAEVFKKPDRKGKRFKRGCHTVPSAVVLSKIKVKHPKYSDLTTKQLEDIIYGFSSFLIKKVSFNREGVELPENTGIVMLTSYKSNKRLIDKARSEQLGVKVYHNNMLTDGFMMKIFYSNNQLKYKLPNREIWGMNPLVEFKIFASRVFKEDWKKFVQLERMAKPKKKYSTISGNQPFIDPEENYNEFDI